MSIGKYFVAVILAGIFASCGTRRTPNSCEGAMCTADFRMITVAIVDSNGNKFTPDTLKTYDENNQLINICSESLIPIDNAWTVLSDTHKDLLGVNVNNTVYTKTFVNGNVYSQDTFVVKADCCHIMKVSGPDTITVQ